MKPILFLGMAMVLITACGSNETEKKTTTSETRNEAAAADDPRIQQGLEMVAKNDCFACHKVAEQLTGPAYMDVAERYKDSSGIEDTLADRIIKGSSGHWGPALMTAHPNLPHDSARLMVDYILSLKK